MSYNPFASYNIEIPSCYREQVLKYCRTGGQKSSEEFAPFDRQVDFWYLAFIFAVNKKLEPVQHKEKYNATVASILSTDPERISFIQLSVLGLIGEIEVLGDNRKLFEYSLSLANAGMPYLIQILEDPDDRPLWSLMDALELMSK